MKIENALIPDGRGLCKATRRIRTNGAKLEQGLGKGHGCEAMKAPVGLLSNGTVLHSKMEGHCPDKLGGICDRECQDLQGASRWFCKFYCRNAVIVGLIARRSSAFPFNQCISAF